MSNESPTPDRLEPVPFDADEAKRNKVVFYELPQNLYLANIDELMRPVVAKINASGWVWTAECCQGHPEYDGTTGGWDFNTDPFLRLVSHRSRFGDMLAALVESTLLSDSVNRARRSVPVNVFFWPDDIGEWRQVNVYLEARNVLQRNEGIEAFQQFADSLKTIPSERPDSKQENLRQAVSIAEDAMAYAVNRLDHDPRGPQQQQVAADLAVALAAIASLKEGK